MDVGIPSDYADDSETVLTSLADYGNRVMFQENTKLRKRSLEDDEDCENSSDLVGGSDNIRQQPDVVSNTRTPGVFKFRRRISSDPNIDYFNDYNVPPIVLEEMCSYLNTKDLCNLSMTCKLFYKQVHERTSANWKALNLHKKVFYDQALVNVLDRRPRVIRLSEATVKSNPAALTRLPSLRRIDLNNLSYLLTHLDLGRAVFENKDLLSKIINGCKSLQALSLENHVMNDEIATGIAQNSNLQFLDLSLARDMKEEDFMKILRGCRKLCELNLCWCNLDKRTVTFICDNLPSTIRCLNMSGTEKKEAIIDSDILNLLRSCPNIVELDLSDNTAISCKGLEALLTLSSLHTLSLSRCYGINPMSLLLCDKIPELNVHGCLTSDGEVVLKNSLANTKVNEKYFSYIAKPTPPPSITSIWGQSTRDRY